MLNSLLLNYLKAKNVKGLNKVQKVRFLNYRERKCALSIDFRPFGPSILDGARSKAILRGEGYTWTPILWSYGNSKSL